MIHISLDDKHESFSQDDLEELARHGYIKRGTDGTAAADGVESLPPFDDYCVPVDVAARMLARASDADVRNRATPGFRSDVGVRLLGLLREAIEAGTELQVLCD